MVAIAKNDELKRVIDEEGNIVKGARPPDIADEELRKIYRTLLQVRVVDERMMRLQRQGRLGFYMQSTGEEATHLAVAALRPSDWVFPSYREPGAAFYRGYELEQFIAQLYGNAADPIKGRQMPVHHSMNWINYVSISSPVGTQIPQATGMAMAAKIQGKDDVAIVYFGEGATSTGEFHVGANFAGVFKAPVIFLCRNNGWAISTSADRQTAAKTFASKAVGYGMPGIRVDGNDVLALYQATADAAERARAGDGPTFIEALTYRVHGHSSSDDPSVYRDPDEPKRWQQADPLARFQRYLGKKKLWTPEWEEALRTEFDQAITVAHDKVANLPPPDVETLFDDVFEELPSHLREQKEWLMAQPRTKSPHYFH